MAKQTLLWTVLPNGVDPDSGRLRVSVLVSPRLMPAGDPQRLDTFPDFSDADGGRWIATVRGAKFEFRFGAQSIDRTGADLDDRVDLPDDATWDALLRPDTLVRDHSFKDRTGNTVVSFDTVGAHQLLEQTYRELGRITDDLPTIESLLANPTLRTLVGAVAETDMQSHERKTGLRRINELFERYAADGFKSQGPLGQLLSTFQLFHTPPSAPSTQTYTPSQVGAGDPRLDAEWQTFEKAKLPLPSEFAKRFDFHEIATAMQQYPRILRRLGLVLDFTLDRRSVGTSADSLLSVIVTLPTRAGGVARKSISARTHTRAGRAVFEPVPTPNGAAAQRFVVDRGLLRPDERLFVLQTDVDGGMHKLINFARSMRGKINPELHTDPVTKQPVRAGVPGLRNGGISLVHRGRGTALKQVFARNKASNTAAVSPLVSPELWWEDLVMGFRADVWDRVTERWRSLCERVSQYALDGGAVVVPDVREESTIRMAATSAADGSRPDVVYLHETIMTWAGWSLAARAPTRIVGVDDTVADADPTVPAGIRLSTQFEAAPGTLPRLRYGRSYALRVRVVDLAGNSLSPNPKDYQDERPADRAAPYLRFDPVPAPNLALVRTGAQVAGPLEGESMDLLAIRSFNEVFDDPALSTQVARRYAIPQRTNVREAELHGVLDAGGKLDPATFAMLADLDKELESHTISLAGPLGSAPSAADYAVLDEGARLPYLPDPLSETIAARFLNHARIPASKVISIPLYPLGSWPTAVPFLIEVYESSTDAPAYHPATHTLRVPLAKAERATLRLSSRLTPQALSLLGVWKWLADPGLAAEAREGRLWALTPWRDIDMVHAVQRPLLLPDILSLAVRRRLGETFVVPTIRSRCSIASTARVELRAAWNEPRDGSTEGGRNIARTDTATTVKITNATLYGASHDLSPDLSKPGLSEHTIPAPDEIEIGPRKLSGPSRLHEFGDTRYRRIEYWYDATTRFREYLTPEVLTEEVAPDVRLPTEKGIMVTGAKSRTWVPSSAPPPAPKVLYVVPTFEWVRTVDDTTGRQSSMRRGGGVRIYLDRPWNESGYGEMLAVVLLPGTGTVPDANGAQYKSIVTQWGNDPAWKSPFVRGQAPRRADFPLARTAADPAGNWLPSFAPPEEADQPPGPFQVTGLTLPASAGSPGTQVEIAPHDVFYDAQRELWYCDIEINPGLSYFPFVRLALARYQPVSLPGAHLSTVVLADFMALTPSRWLSVTPGETPMTHTVSVYGHTHSENAGWRENLAEGMSVRNPFTGEFRVVVPSGISPRNIIELWIERLSPALGEDLGWNRVSTSVVAESGSGSPFVPVRPVRPGMMRRATPREVTRANELVAGRRFDVLLNEHLLELVLAMEPLWSGMVTLTDGPVEGQRYRLVIAEYEEYLADDATPYQSPTSGKARRLVFVEHVELR